LKRGGLRREKKFAALMKKIKQSRKKSRKRNPS